MSYDATFFQDRSAARRSADVVVPMLIELLEPSSVVDVGCGTGEWLAAFGERGIDDVLGLDGAYVPRAQLAIPEQRFRAVDLAHGFELDRRFDLALSLEVAEHLPEGAAPGFVRSLTRASDLVLFSAAIPDQRGENHVNEQWQQWWADLFAGHGYVPVDWLRRRIWSDERVSWWYAQNTLLYASEVALAARPELRREYETMGTGQLSIVHPTRTTLFRDPLVTRIRRRIGR